MMASFQVLPPWVFIAIALILAVLAGTRSLGLPRWGVLAILFALPFQKSAATGVGLLARFAVVDLLTIFALAGTVIAIVRGRARSLEDVRLPKQFLLGMALFLPAVAQSFLVTEVPSRSIVETTAYVANLVIFGLIVLHIRTREQLYRCLAVWEWAVVTTTIGAVIGAILLFQGSFDTLLTNGPKVTSTFKKSAQLAFYLVASLPVLWFQCVYRSRPGWPRALRGVLIAMVLVAVLATGARTGFLLEVVLVVALFGGRWVAGVLRGRVILKLSAAVLATLILLPGLRALSDSLPFSFQRALSIAAEESVSLEELSQARYYGMLGFQVAASEYPLTGVGVGDFYSRSTSFVPGSWLRGEIHNTFLAVWAETGILGAAALVLFYAAVAQASWQTVFRARDRTLAALGFALFVSWVAICLYGLASFGLRTRHAWALFGLIIAAWNVLGREGPGALLPGERAAGGPSR